MSVRPKGEGTWLEEAVSPPFLFLAGMAVIPAFVLQERIDIKAVQVAVFLLLVMLGGARPAFRTLWTALILFASTLLFNLVTPLGRVLFEWGPMVVTEGALSTGLFKALTLVGLLLLSRLSVRRAVVLPGMLGLYVSTTLSDLNLMLEAKWRTSRRGLLAGLDQLFESVLLLEPRLEQQKRQPPGAKPRTIGLVSVLAFVGANWTLVFFPG